MIINKNQQLFVFSLGPQLSLQKNHDPYPWHGSHVLNYKHIIYKLQIVNISQPPAYKGCSSYTHRLILFTVSLKSAAYKGCSGRIKTALICLIGHGIFLRHKKGASHTICKYIFISSYTALDIQYIHIYLLVSTRFVKCQTYLRNFPNCPTIDRSKVFLPCSSNQL